MFSDDIAVGLWECQDKITDWQQQYCNYHWCNLGTLESWQSWWWWDTVTWSQKITLHPVLRANISNIIKSQQRLIQKQCYINIHRNFMSISLFSSGTENRIEMNKIIFLLERNKLHSLYSYRASNCMYGSKVGFHGVCFALLYSIQWGSIVLSSVDEYWIGCVVWCGVYVDIVDM